MFLFHPMTYYHMDHGSYWSFFLGYNYPLPPSNKLSSNSLLNVLSLYSQSCSGSSFNPAVLGLSSHPHPLDQCTIVRENQDEVGWSPASEHVQRSWHMYSSALIYTRVNVFIVIVVLCFHRLRHRINTSSWLIYRVLQKLILASILLSFMKSGVFQRSFILTTFLFSWQSFWCLVPSISDTKIECIFVIMTSE